MRFLAFTDLHADMNTLTKLVMRAREDDIDILVTAGDYSLFEDHANTVLKKLDSVGKPVVIIPGNHESPKSVRAAEKKFKNIINIHKKHWEFQGVTFMGFGTDGFSQTDKEFRDVAKKWKKELKSHKAVLVTHGPPYGIKLDKINKEFVGNKDYTNFIKQFQPSIAISGHIHENAGKKDKLGRTICINPGWEGKVLEIK